MYPVTLLLMRQATNNYQVPGQSLVIEKGQKIVIPVNSIHHDPKYYPDPDIFDPERFSTEEKSKRLNGTYIPFGDGPRLCIGTLLSISAGSQTFLVDTLVHTSHKKLIFVLRHPRKI